MSEKNKIKILVTFLYRLRNKDEYLEIEKNYIEKGYKIYNIEYEKDNFTPNVFSRIYENIIEKEGINFQSVVISNVKDVLFLWSKVYSEVVEEFFYFIDRYNYSLIKEELDEEFLEKTQNIEIKNKVKININYNNIENFIEDGIKNRNFKNVISNEIKYKKIVLGEKVSKKYELNGEKKDFSIFGIVVKEENIQEIEVRNTFEQDLYENSWFIPFFISGVYKKYGLSAIRELCIPFFKYMVNIDNSDKVRIVNLIINYFSKNSLDYKERIAAYSLLIVMEPYYHVPTEVIMNEMKNDEQNIETHYSAMATIIMSITEKNLILHKNFYKDSFIIVENMKKIYMKNEIMVSKNKSKTIFFIVDELLITPHSGTQLIFDLIINFKKKYREYAIVIYVEDNFFGIEEEDIMGYSLIREKKNGFSEIYSSVHKSYASKLENIFFYYSDIKKKKVDRVEDILKIAIQINPEIVISTTTCSYSTNILYEYFPLGYLSLGSPNAINKFDIHLLPHKENSSSYLKLFNGDFGIENYYDFEYGTEFKESKSTYKREDYKIKEEDFVMVTVGFRLKNEITDDFAEIITNFIKKYENIKWFTVGEIEVPAIDKNYTELIGNKIIKVKYEKNIGAFYKLCNIYINPVREGGGFSISEAIVNGIGIISYRKSAAGVHYGGIENCVENDVEYLAELEKRYLDREYMQRKYIKAFETNSKYTYDKNIDVFYGYINKAKEFFTKRSKNR